MIAGYLVVGRFVVVVSHQVYGVDILLHLSHLRVVEHFSRSSCSDRDKQLSVESLLHRIKASA